ncbi:hypothetical protein SAMN05216548_11436 [Faunimonas pinastri]|uniref:Uncharacterized protein n=1 Tax=Faunimonas pinastri TaxID=1855383 RepID=A0A1H9MSX6_9HYPH|nr:hypothetical protein [Faunimonas pinastri]SER26804.1 hypothetical protein SAMN05216548_11436 [Faunimonas pinastri]
MSARTSIIVRLERDPRKLFRWQLRVQTWSDEFGAYVRHIAHEQRSMMLSEATLIAKTYRKYHRRFGRIPDLSPWGY